MKMNSSEEFNYVSKIHRGFDLLRLFGWSRLFLLSKDL